MGRIGAIDAKVCATKSALELFSTNALNTHYRTQKSCFVAFCNVGCIWDRFVTAQTRSKMGRTGSIKAKVHATKSRQNFSLRTHPIHTMGPETHVLLHFVMFGCVWDHFVSALNSVQMGQSGAINAKCKSS